MKWSFWMKWSITISYRNENCEMTLEKLICQFVYWESPLKIFFNQKLPFSAPNTCNFSQYWQCWKTRNISCGRGRGPNLKNLAKNRRKKFLKFIQGLARILVPKSAISAIIVGGGFCKKVMISKYPPLDARLFWVIESEESSIETEFWRFSIRFSDFYEKVR